MRRVPRRDGGVCTALLPRPQGRRVRRHRRLLPEVDLIFTFISRMLTKLQCTFYILKLFLIKRFDEEDEEDDAD